MKPLGRRVVGTGRPHDVNSLEAQFGFERAQGIDLTGNTDDRDLAMARRPRGLQQGEQRRVAHAHAAALRHIRRARHQNGHGPPAVVGVRRHGEHGVDGAGFQQSLGDAGRDARPLRAGERSRERRARYAQEWTEKQFVRPRRVARAAMNSLFHSFVIRIDELAGAPAPTGIIRARHATVRAKRSSRGGAQLGRRGLRQDIQRRFQKALSRWRVKLACQSEEYPSINVSTQLDCR